MKQITKIIGVLTLTAFLAFTTPVVHAQTGGGTGTTATTDDDDDDDNDGDDSGKIGLAGLLGLLGLLGLKRRDNDNHRRS